MLKSPLTSVLKWLKWFFIMLYTSAIYNRRVARQYDVCWFKKVLSWKNGTLHIFFRNFFLFVQIRSWNFQHMFESSQNSSLFRQHSDEILWEIKVVRRSTHFVRFMKSVIKRRLKISAFYHDKQKSLIPKKIWTLPFLQARIVFLTNRWPYDNLSFLIHSFAPK